MYPFTIYNSEPVPRLELVNEMRPQGRFSCYRERANCFAHMAELKDVEVTATSLRYEGEVRSETCTVPVGKETPCPQSQGIQSRTQKRPQVSFPCLAIEA